MPEESIDIGDPVVYFDEDGLPFAAIIAHIYTDRPSDNVDFCTCNLAMFKRDGRVANRIYVEPAYNDGTRWHLINKWAPRHTVPEEEWSWKDQPQNVTTHPMRAK